MTVGTEMENMVSMSSPEGGRNGVPVLRSVSGFEAVDRTFAQMLRDRAEREPDTVAFCSWVDGDARPTSWSEYLEEVRETTLGLHDLGVAPGDRVAIMSSTRREWVVAALAILVSAAFPSACIQPARSPRLSTRSKAAAQLLFSPRAHLTSPRSARSPPDCHICVQLSGSMPSRADLPETVKTVHWDY